MRGSNERSRRALIACAALLSTHCDGAMQGDDPRDAPQVEAALAALPARSSLTIARAARPPIIDGSPDAVWTTAESHAIARTLRGPAPALADTSAYFRALWDAERLYFLVDVNDDARVRDADDPWEDDSVEIYLDGNAGRSAAYDADDFQYVFRVRDRQVHVGARSAPADPEVRFATTPTSTGYRLEAAIPWSRLGGVAAVGRMLGLDVHVNDDDDGGPRDGKIAWAAATDDAWENPRSFLPVALESTPPPTLLTVIPAATPLPLLDGARDEQFLRSPAHPIARPVRGDAPAPADLSASWRALHDAVFLYLVVEVRDDRVVRDSDASTPWHDDAVELFLDANGSGGDGYDGVDDVQLVFRPGERLVHLGLNSAPVRPSDIGVLTSWTAGGYVLEAYVPWAAIPSVGGRGKHLRMDVHVDDDDDGGERDAKLTWWSSDDEAWQVPERLARVRLGATYAGEEEPFASFEGLGDLPGGARASAVTAMDPSGRVVIGYSTGAAGDEAVRWTRSFGLQGLGNAPSRAQGVSPDGTWVVGTASGGPEGAISLWRGGAFTAFRRGEEAFPGGPPMFSIVEPHVVLDDGSVFASCIQYAAYGELLGCRLDAPGRVTLALPTSEFFAADGAGNLGGVRYGGRREPIGSVAMLNGRELGYPPDVSCVIPHACSSAVRAFSRGAAVAVGVARIPPPGGDDSNTGQMTETAFVYSDAAGMERLPDLPGAADASAAYAVSADGSRIGGFGSDEQGEHAVLWLDRAPRKLHEVAQAAGVRIPPGWRLLEVVAMSADGEVVVGNGINPAGEPEAFRIALPVVR